MSKTKLTKVMKNSIDVKNILDEGLEVTFNFKWGVSKARDTYGYNICSCYVNGIKVGSCNGGNYDMEGESFGEFVNVAFENELLTLQKEKDELKDRNFLYGLYGGKIDGSCGISCSRRVLEKIGYKLEEKWNKKDGTYLIVKKVGTDNE